MVTLIQHEPGEGPGTLAPFLGEHRLVRTFAGGQVPSEADALVVLGGGMGANEQDRLPHLRDEIRLLRRCVEEGRPVLGICLGSQLLAAALGGTVARAAAPEIGFYRVRLAPAARDDALFAGVEESFVAFHWHNDAFTLPGGAVPLAGSTMTPLQAYRFGERAWGIQFHLEIDEPLLRAMLEGNDPEGLIEQSRRELPPFRKIAATVFSRWGNAIR
jgi:GMP synthase (glutamine-hydrolysing)